MLAVQADGAEITTIEGMAGTDGDWEKGQAASLCCGIDTPDALDEQQTRR